jgi:hypothetical protein
MRKKFLSSLFVFTLIFALAATSSAYAQCNSHSQLELTATEKGGYYSANNINMNANWTSTQHPFVLRTMWTVIDTNYSWVETGFMDGDLNGANYHGFYVAYGISNSVGTLVDYNEYSVSGPSTTVGTTHNFEVQYIGNNYWRAYFDLNSKLDVYSTTGYGLGVNIGWETGATNSPYTNFTYDSPNQTTAHQYQNASGVWNNWSSGTPNNADRGCSNNAQMPVAKFSNPGTIDYTKGIYTHP